MLMFKERYELFKLNSKLRRLYQKYDSDIKKLKKKGEKTKDIDALIAERFAVCREYEVEIDRIYTIILINKAKTRFIDVPGHSEGQYWDENNYGYRILSEKGRSLLNRKIREVDREHVEMITKIIASIIGIIGAITGLVAILTK